MNFLIWILLLGIFAVCTFWHIRENNQLFQQWKKKLDADSAHWMGHFAWSRTVQLLLTLACSIIVIIAYDWQLNDANKKLDQLTIAKSASDNQLSEAVRKNASLDAALQRALTLNRQPASPIAAASTNIIQPSTAVAAVATPITQNAPASSISLTPSEEEATTPVTLNAPDESEVMETPVDDTIIQPAPISKAVAQTVDEVYNPEKTQKGSQSAIDDIKKRYDDILVIYYFFKKCKMAKSREYNIITSAMQQELDRAKATPKEREDIIAAAKSSYKELYSKSACTGDQTTQLYNQYLNYIKALATNFSINL